MRLRWITGSAVLIGIFGAIGCGGSGSNVNNPNGSAAGDWVGSFSEARLAGASSGDLDIHYSQSGADVSGTARLTVVTSGVTASYIGTVTGTDAGGDIDATITFNPALPGGQTSVHLVGTVDGDSFSGTYTSDGESGTVTQSHFTSTPVVTNGSTWLGTITSASDNIPKTFRVVATSTGDSSFAGTSLIGTDVAGTVAGVQIGNRVTFTTTSGATGFVCTGTTTSNVVAGTWVSTASTATHGTFSIAKQ
ncbi:hypothetical protein [Fimbriimonas ginsengisoli]|uniref:Lipoprotein n=1 Tax=Fimbriimonas ginsengisoli Gsoil 348 TaxID=661478 RepID=A0A068NYH2_FIMGI|nr:hypothetical protein [Fimbriimonas ginsengisoli]AIE88130.1 hypothetical protein OP10G_4762 [Fimbriimonas ginsengisoli Gsoil 348]